MSNLHIHRCKCTRRQGGSLRRLLSKQSPLLPFSGRWPYSWSMGTLIVFWKSKDTIGLTGLTVSHPLCAMTAKSFSYQILILPWNKTLKGQKLMSFLHSMLAIFPLWFPDFFFSSIDHKVDLLKDTLTTGLLDLQWLCLLDLFFIMLCCKWARHKVG